MLGSFAQVETPASFLGYELGSRYSRHHQIVDYFKHAAKEKPDMVKLQQYGETNEHRPLIAAFISSPENMARLEQIRQNNLSLANMAASPGISNPPVIVWLSYNVHGNETSSSEAAMKTLFALLDPENTDAKKWLQNTVVVIDPCLNPDGRDRYVNWYTTVIGKEYNPMPIAREHREPWPGGRSNHYNYDLNRDWVWQTQKESKDRVALYNQWLPQIHVDFHEQSVNAPYYFAPAAQPYHEVITEWQRDFQKTIGRNHAKYFDREGWLYFTAERFDLFYPSYGDTYPLYNGSIGMTYEQGGISAGLGILTNEKDTLTLAERVLHHYTSGISTIEIASQNVSRLLTEFGKFFNDAVNGKVGTYKTYIIKNKPEDAQRIRALTNLMDRNGIIYGTGSGRGQGFNYQTKRSESFTIAANDLVISGVQPKAALVKVLFEPQSKLVDSVTYDITAWAMPYAYGLTAFASTQNIAVNPSKMWSDFQNNEVADVYAYAIKWEGMQTAGAVGKLLQKGVRLRFSEVPFESGGNSFGRGTVIINKNGNKNLAGGLWETVAQICNAHQVSMYPVASGMVDRGADFGSDRVRVLKPVRVAMLTGETVSSLSAGQIWDYFDNHLEYPITLIDARDFDRVRLSEFDVLILPNGRYSFLDNKASATSLENWLRSGGRLIAFESAVPQLSKQEWSVIKTKSDTAESNQAKVADIYEALRTYDERERDAITDYIPGAIYKVDVDNTHPLMFGYPNYYYTLKLDPQVYQFIKEGGWNAGYLKKENYLSGYVGHKLTPKLADGLLFGVQELGRGSVVYLTDDVIFRNFWETGKLMLANAVFLVGE